MFWDKFYTLCSARGVATSKVLRDLGLSTSKIDYWKKGAIPRDDVMRMLADYLDVPAEDLANPEVNYVFARVGEGERLHTLSGDEDELLDIYSSLDRAKRLRLMAYALELSGD